MASTAPLRCIYTSHDEACPKGSYVELHDNAVPLSPALEGKAAFAPLFASLGLPASSSATITDDEIENTRALAPDVVVPGGVNGRVTDLAPNFYVKMHRTNSIDYNIFLSGSAYLITPDGEGVKKTLVKAGEVVVQRGTLHAWEAGPDGARYCTVVVAAKPVEIDGHPLDEVDFK